MQLTLGALLAPFQVPRNPKEVLAPGLSNPLWDTLLAVTDDPLVVTVAFHELSMRWPSLKVQVTRQPLIADEPAVTCTSPWKPPGHWLTIV